MEEITVNKFVIERIENTLRLFWNNMEDTNCCLGRDCKESLNFCHKLLREEKITGRERFEEIIW